MERGSRVLQLRVTSLVEAVRANNATKFKGDENFAVLWATLERLNTEQAEPIHWSKIVGNLSAFRGGLNELYRPMFDQTCAELNAEFSNVR